MLAVIGAFFVSMIILQLPLLVGFVIAVILAFIYPIFWILVGLYVVGFTVAIIAHLKRGY